MLLLKKVMSFFVFCVLILSVLSIYLDDSNAFESVSEYELIFNPQPVQRIYTKDENYCLDLNKRTAALNLVKKYPNDEELIKIVALRMGICQLIAARAITLELGIELFAVERQRLIDSRNEQPNYKNP